MEKNKNIDLGCSIGKTWKVEEEKVSGKKFRSGMFNITSPILWLKTLSFLFNIRNLIIIAIIVGGIFSYGWYQGRLQSPAKFDIGRYEETIIKWNGEQLHIYKNGEVWIEDFKTKKKIKQITVKDIPLLKAKLAPLKLKLRPIIIAGYGTNTYGDSKAEIGAGVSFFEYWKMSLEAFITSYPAAYLGTSYRITDNSGIGIGVGKGIEDGSNRALIYYRIRF